MRHMGQKHGGQRLLPESMGSCLILTVGPAWSVSPHCRGDATVAVSATATHHFGNFVLRLFSGPLAAWASGRSSRRHTSIDQQVSQSSQPVPPGEPLGDSPLPNCTIRTERDKYLLAELRRASAMACPRWVVSRCATAWAKSLAGGMSGHQSWALLCRHRCRLLLADRCRQKLRAETTTSLVGNVTLR